jgi:hypothetical protein
MMLVTIANLPWIHKPTHFITYPFKFWMEKKTIHLNILLYNRTIKFVENLPITIKQ